MWIAGIIFALIAFGIGTDDSDKIGFIFLGIIIIAVLIFFTVGWKHQKRCPKCQSVRVQKMEYGLPANPGSNPNVYDAGCEEDDNSPEWHCADCGHEWRTSARYCTQCGEFISAENKTHVTHLHKS